MKEISELCQPGSVLIGDVLADGLKKNRTPESKKVWDEKATLAISFCSKPDELVGKFGFECSFYPIGHKEANFGRFDKDGKTEYLKKPSSLFSN